MPLLAKIALGIVLLFWAIAIMGSLLDRRQICPQCKGNSNDKKCDRCGFENV
jgi:hypothetical protein